MSHTEENCYFGFDSGKNVNFKLSGEDFFMVCIKLKNNCYCFLLYVVKLVTYVKNLPLGYLSANIVQA